MVDYVVMAEVAERLVRESGRTVTFMLNEETPDDPLKPWEGSTTAPATLDLVATFVPPNTVRQFGLTALGQGTEFVDLISFSENIGIIFPGDNDLTAYTHVLDKGVKFGIVGVQLLEPGAIKLLAFVGLRR